jgi:SAM-dependent methyltransferase
MMDLDRIYEYRFRDVDHVKRRMVWDELARFMHKKLKSPNILLDPAAGMCEFINASPAKEKWAVDLNEPFIRAHADKDLHIVIGDTLSVDLPKDHFEGVFVSNFLEHLHSQEEVAAFLRKLYGHLKTGGRIAIMGPNFKYVYKEYFDFADHTVILSELGVAEHLYGAGFEVEAIHPRFLPLSFRGGLPVNKFLVRTFLSMPFAWRFFGKQFLLIGRK